MASLDILLPPVYSLRETDKTLHHDVKARIRSIQQKFHKLHRKKSSSQRASHASVRVPIYCEDNVDDLHAQLAQLGLPTVTRTGQQIDYQVISADRSDDEALPTYTPREYKPGFRGWLRRLYRSRELVREDGSVIWDEVAGLCIIIFFTVVVVVALAVVIAALI
jgi:hypothetical protein